MYNPQVPMNAQQMGQPMPQGGNMPVNPGQMAPGAMPPGGMMPPAMGAPAMGAPAMGAPGAAGAPMQPIDPEVMQQILQLQAQQGRRSRVDRQMALADQLRADANTQLSGRRTGIANVGAAALNGYAAKKQMDEANAAGGKLDDERVAASGKFMDLIRGLRGGGGGAGGPGMGFGGL
jgi:hypothetical protein